MSNWVVEITWSDGNTPRRELYGPWPSVPGESQPPELRQFLADWSAGNNDPVGQGMAQVKPVLVREPSDWTCRTLL